MKRRTLALIGVGKIAADQHLPAIEATDLFDLVALASLSAVRHDSVPVFHTQAELFAAFPDVECVAICTPPGARYDIAREALQKGKHVLVEKPPTAGICEIDDLAALASRGHRTLFAAWHSRFNEAVEEAGRRLTSAGVRQVTVTWKEDVRRWHPGQEWVWQPGGFGVFDPGINALSILTKIVPFPLFVSSAELLYPANRETPIAAALAMRGPADCGADRLDAEFDWRQQGEQTWTIEALLRSGERVELAHGGRRLRVDGRTVVEHDNTEYRQIYRRFRELVESQRSDCDTAPLRLVADASTIGRRRMTEPFEW